MKKKCYIAFLMLVLTVPMVLTGCKGAEKEIVSDELADGDEETEKDDTGEDEGKEKETEDTQEGGKKQKAGKEEAGEEVTPIKAARGEVKDDKFVNEVFGISFPLTEDMVLLEDSEILEGLGVDTGFLEEGAAASPEEMEDAVGGTLYDAIIFLNDGDSTNVMVTYENMDVTLNGDYLDERRYIKTVTDSLERESPGQYEIKSQKTVTLGDVQYLRVDLNVEMEGNELKEVFFCRRLENYMVCITVTFDEEMRQTVEDFIASLDDGGENGGADQSSSQSIEGTVENGYYTNETFGIRFPITDNMRVMGEKEMDTVQGIGSEYMEDEGIASEEQIEKASDGTLYDAAIYLEDGLSNISVCYENMDITYGGSIDVDEEMYGAALRLMMSRLEGFDYEFREDSTEVLGGKEYYRMDFDVSARGTDIYQIYIFRKEENYMISFIITYQDGMEQQVDDFLNSITDV